jgi:hypothetical protein
MADSDKNIRITTNKNKATVLPNIVFTGASAGTSVLTLEVRDDNTVAFTGADGDVFSLDYNLSTGTIWSVNDKSGTPLLRASAGGTIGIAELGSGVLVGIGQTNPKYKLDVQGWAGFASTGDGSYTILVENGLTTGNNALSIRAANALRFYNSGNTLFTGFIGVQAGVNTTYTLPPRTPTGTGTSYLSSSIDGVMAWVAAPTSGGSGSVNSGTATYAAFYATTTNAVSENANLQFTGTGVSIGGRINSTSITSGSFYVYGGVGITGNAFIGGTVYIPSTTPSNISNLLVSNSTATTTTTSGALVVSGGLGLAGNAFIGATVYVPSSTASNFSNLLVSNSTSSTSTSTGALVVGGGLGIAGNAFIGGTVTQQNNTSSFGTNSGAVTIVGGVGIAGNAFIGGTFVHQSTTSSFGTNSGSVTLAGGVGIAGNAFIGGTFVHQSTTSSVGTNSGSVTLAGGIGIAGNAFIGGTFVNQNSTSSVGTNSGAITVAGGVGIAGNAFIGGTTTIQSTQATLSASSGAMVVIGGAAVGQTLSVGGRLNIFNGANYTGFRFAGSADTTYTLPPRTPTGTATSYLSSSIDGVMAWVAAPTSGGAGNINASTAGKVAYYSGSTTISGDTNYYFDYSAATGRFLIANADTEAVPNSSTLFLGVGTGATNFSLTGFRKTLAAFITNNAWTDGDLLVLGVAGAGTTQKFAVDYRGYTQIGVPGTGFTLPVTNGTSGQVLTANTNGVASWTTVTGSSGAGSGTVAIPGAQYQVAAYYWSATGASVSGSTTFTNNTATGVVDINHTTESTSTTTGALVVDGGAGIAKSLFVGTTLSVGAAPGYNITNNLASFVSTVNSYNQVVVQNKSNGTSASADFVLNNNLSTDTAYYANFGINSSTFSGTGSLALPNAAYVTSTTGDLVLGTTTANALRFVINAGTSDVFNIPSSGTAVSFFQPIDIKTSTNNNIRFWNTSNTFYTNFGAGSNTVNYDLFTPTAPVGAGLSVILVNSAGQMFFAPVVGIGVSPVGSNTAQLRRRRTLTFQFCAGFTPAASGPDSVVLKIPDSALDGTTDVTYTLRELDVRVETPSSGSSRIMVERYNGTGAFAYAATGTSLVGGLGLTISGAGIYFTSTTSFAAGALVTSNDKLRLNWTLLNATHANFSIQLTMEQV